MEGERGEHIARDTHLAGVDAREGNTLQETLTLQGWMPERGTHCKRHSPCRDGRRERGTHCKRHSPCRVGCQRGEHIARDTHLVGMEGERGEHIARDTHLVGLDAREGNTLQETLTL